MSYYFIPINLMGKMYYLKIDATRCCHFYLDLSFFVVDNIENVVENHV